MARSWSDWSDGGPPTPGCRSSRSPLAGRRDPRTRLVPWSGAWGPRHAPPPGRAARWPASPSAMDCSTRHGTSWRRSPRPANRSSSWCAPARPWRKAAPGPPANYAQSALDGGSPDAARYLAMIAARAAVLEPDWTPDLGATGAAFRVDARVGRSWPHSSRRLAGAAVPPGRLHAPQPVGRGEPGCCRPRAALRDDRQFSRQRRRCRCPARLGGARRPVSPPRPGVHRQRLPRPDGDGERTRRPRARRARPAGRSPPGVEPPPGAGRAGPRRAARDPGRVRGPRLHRGDVGVAPGTRRGHRAPIRALPGGPRHRNPRHGRFGRGRHALGDDAPRDHRARLPARRTSS